MYESSYPTEFVGDTPYEAFDALCMYRDLNTAEEDGNANIFIWDKHDVEQMNEEYISENQISDPNYINLDQGSYLMVIYTPNDLHPINRVLDHEPTIEELNDALSLAYPDYGFKIKEVTNDSYID